MAMCLVQSGAEPSVNAFCGYSPLHYAHDALVLAAMLKAQGKNLRWTVNDRDLARGATPLIWQAEQGRCDNCALLLDAKADVDARDHLGRTALMHACESAVFGVIALLLGAGADLGAEDNLGRTAIEFCPRATPTQLTCRSLIAHVKAQWDLAKAAELKREQKADQTGVAGTCAICQVGVACCAFQCGHMYCVDCSGKVQLCPTCRQPISQRIKLFF
jgi:hypothetical protein